MRRLKKIAAMFLAVAMLFSIASINVFADNETLSLTFDAKVDGVAVDATTKVGAGDSIVLSVGLKANSAEWSGGITQVNLAYDSTKFDVTVNSGASTLMAGNPNNDTSDHKVKAGSMGLGAVSTSGIEYMNLTFTVKESAATGETDVFTLDGGNTNFNASDFSSATYSVGAIPKVTVAKVDKVTAIGTIADTTANLGDTKEAIAAKLASDITVEGTNEGGKVTLKTKDWTSTDFKADKKGEYTFSGTAYSTDKFAPIKEGVSTTVSVKVKIDGITLADDMVTSTYEDIKVKQEKDATTKLTAAEIAALATGDAYTKATISKNGKFEETTATVAWVAAEGAELDKATLSDLETKANVVELTGTVTPAAGGNYTGTATVKINVYVVPAEIKGGEIIVDTAAQYGNGVVTVKVPDGTEVNEDLTVEVYKAKYADDKYVVDGEAPVATKVVEAKDVVAGKYVSVTLDSFDAMGFDTNDYYAVKVKVGTAALYNGEAEDTIFSSVLPQANKRPSSNGGSSNGGTTVVDKKHDVTVAEGTNGTASVATKDAKVGDTVKIDVKPNDGYKVKDIIVKTKDGKTVEVNVADRTFVMPDGEVTIEVVYEEGTEEPAVDNNDGKFSDVPESFWAAADVYLLKEAGIINGKSEGEFDPEGKVTRAEFTKMIVNLFGVKATNNTVAFTDCGADDWFTPYVAAAVEAGYVKGVTDTEFGPDVTITREDACTILGRAYAKTSEKELSFTDGDGIADYAAPYVALLVEMGYVNGYEDGTFLPKNEITRAEAAKIIAGAYRAALAAKEEVVDENGEAEVVDEVVEDVVDDIDVAPEK